MEYGGEVALDYSVMKNQAATLGEMSRLPNTVLTSNKNEYSAFKVVQPKTPNNNNNNNNHNMNNNNNNNTLDYG